MHANHNFPDELSLPSLDCAEAPPRVEEETYRAKRLFPTREKSKSMRWGALGFFLNNYSFSLLFGILYTFFFYMLQSRSRLQSGGTGTILDRLHEATNVWELPGIHFSVVIHAPNLILFLLIFLGGLIAMAESKKVGLRILQGVAHTLGHVAVFTLLSWGIVKLSFVIAQSCPTWLLVPVLALLTILLGSLAAGLVVGFYLALLPQHQLTYSSQAIKGYKNFLRLHIAEHGVTIYPIGVEKAHRKWRELEKPTSPHKTRSLPAADGEIACTLIETPITIPCHHGSGDEAHSGALDSGK
jgi:hypothetical protein